MSRKEPRLKLSLPIITEWRADNGLLIRTHALSANISYRGLALLLESPHNSANISLERGDWIKVIANHRRFSAEGRVCHSYRHADGRWIIGIELENPLFSWLSRYSTCSQQMLACVPLC